ncbi:unnamed protein product [Arabidopsis thaliana]|uniref:(thale cress) hypothetical protein n=1 Tax=Arabidopsis thaliana TaxID=3702 RepID=A0A7G2EG00_ARATH|nr:unnamed protein product [Arabidopsis thaliana]
MVLVSKAHLFKPTYPPSKERMIGPEALFFHQDQPSLTSSSLSSKPFPLGRPKSPSTPSNT